MLMSTLRRFLLSAIVMSIVTIGTAPACNNQEPNLPSEGWFHRHHDQKPGDVKTPEALKKIRLQQGKALLEARCSMCHDAPAPSERPLEEWPAVMSSMAPRADLSEEESRMIMDYIDSVLQPADPRRR